MHCQGLVFSDNPHRLMDSLIQVENEPPADVWTPLDVATGDTRSGWHTVTEAYKLSPHPIGYGQAVHCVWPTEFMREHLGPYALLPDTALCSRELPRSHVRKRDGQWWAQVPRFFETIGVRWSSNYESRWQGHQFADASEGATVGSLSLEYNLKTHDPNLIVGPCGPVFYQPPGAEGDDVVRRRHDAASLLMRLPSSTPVTLVNWHDTEQPRYWNQDWQPQEPEPAGTGECGCFRSEYDFEYARPYREPSGFEDGDWFGRDA